MLAITVPEPGGPEKLQLSEVEPPAPGPGEVQLRVAAIGINRADILQREGLYPPPPGASPLLGLECAGTISQLGEGVEGWSVGDEVCALLAGGGYASVATVPAAQLLPVPQGVSLETAAALPEAAVTSWLALVERGRLAPGDTFLMHGGSGGIGTFALQLAALFGARVFCTASGAKRAQCEALGAERAIDYESEDFAAILEAEGGADVICDTIGAKYLGRNLRALALDGRIVTIGLLGGRRGEVDLAELLTKRGTMCGVTLRSQSAAAKGFLIAEVREMLWPLLDAGRLRPVVDRAFALADAREAHEYMATGAHVGKVLLVP